MKNYSLPILAFFSLLISSCSAIEGIFKAGAWFGILLVVGVAALILFLFSRGKKG